MSCGSSCGTLSSAARTIVAAEVVGAQVAQRTLAGAADRGAGGRDDDGFGHALPRYPRVVGRGSQRGLVRCDRPPLPRRPGTARAPRPGTRRPTGGSRPGTACRGRPGRPDRPAPARSTERGAGRPDRHGLRPGHPPAEQAGDLAQRRRERPHRAEVRAGTDDDRHAGVVAAGAPRPPGARRSPPGGRIRTASFAPIRITATSGRLADQRPGHLGTQVLGVRAGDRDAGQLDPAAVAAPGAGQQLGQPAADRVGDPLDPDPERGGVTEQHQAQRRARGSGRPRRAWRG